MTCVTDDKCSAPLAELKTAIFNYCHWWWDIYFAQLSRLQ